MVWMPQSWDDVLENLKVVYPIVNRYRALYSVRQWAPSDDDAVNALEAALEGTDSILLRHEIGYVLGQIKNEAALPILRRLLHDELEDEIVRHEAAEGLAAIGSKEAMQDVERYITDIAHPHLRETCVLAVAGLDEGDSKVCACHYQSTDPAKGDPNATAEDIPRFAAILQDATADLFERYKAMFTLRNLHAVTELAGVLHSDRSSSVLRHEVAFVLGQMDDELATDALAESLATLEEHGMIRHEAAIALGTIGGDKCIKALNNYLHDEDLLVAESCEVALATIEYWQYWEDLEARIKAQGD